MAYDLPPVVALITGNASELLAAIGESKAALKDLGDSTEATSAKMDRATDEAAESQIASLGAVGAAHEEVADKADKAAAEVERTEKKAESDSSGFSGRIASIFKGVGNTLGNWGIPFAESVTGMGEKIDEAETKGKGFSQSLSEIGGVITGALGVALVGVGAESVHLADKFQSATDQVSSSAGITVAAATKIGDAFKNITGEETATELSSAYAQVAGQLGQVEGHALSTAQAVQIMTAASDLSDAKMGSLSQTTSTLASVMQAFGLKTKDAAGTSDILFNAANSTGQSVSTLGASLDKVKTKLGGLSPPLSQLSGLLVDMTNHGETGRAAMSTLTTAFTAFLKPVADVATAQSNLKVTTDALPASLKGLASAYQSGKLTATELKSATGDMTTTQTMAWNAFTGAATAANTASLAQAKMGISATTASGQLKPMSTIIGELHDQIAGLSTGQAIAQLTADGFGSSAAKLVGVIQAGPAAYDKATAAVTKVGTAHKAAELQMDTLSGKSKVLGKTLENLGTSLGTWLIPKLELLAKDTLTVINWFQKHKDAAIALAGVIGGVLTVAVTAFAVNTIAKLVSSVSGAIDNLGSFASKIGSVAQTVLQKFGLIQSGSETMAEGVETNVDEMASTTEATTTGMAEKIEATAAGEATTVEATTQGQASSVEAKAEGEAATVEATTVGQEVAVEADAAGEAAGVEARTAGQAAAVEAEAAEEAASVEATTAGMEADVTAESAGAFAGLSGVAAEAGVAAAAVYGLGKALDATGQDNPASSASLAAQVGRGNTTGVVNLANSALAAANAGGTPKPGAASGPPVSLSNPSGGAGMTPVKGKGAAGGMITSHGLYELGESGPEMVIPGNNPSRALQLLGSGVGPIPGLSGGGSSVSAISPSSQEIVIHIAPAPIMLNGQQVATALGQDIRTQTLQTVGRRTGNIYGGNAGRLVPSA